MVFPRGHSFFSHAVDICGPEDTALRSICSKLCAFSPRIEDATKIQVECSAEELEGSTERSCSGVDDNL